MTGRLYNWVEGLGVMPWWPSLTSICGGQVLTYWLKARDLRLGRAIDLEYTKKVSDIRYKIESCEITKSSAKSRIKCRGIKD